MLWAQAIARVKRSRTSWWNDDQELRDGLKKWKHMGKNTTGSSCDWARPVTTKTESESVRHRSRHRERWKSIRSDWWATVLATLFLLLPSWIAPFVPLHRIRGLQRIRIQRLYSSSSLCLTHPFVFFLFVFDVTTYCHQQCASAHLANSASHTSFNRLFFAGSWPFHSRL